MILVKLKASIFLQEAYYMADLKNGCPPENSSFKEAVCIDAGRVYDPAATVIALRI